LQATKNEGGKETNKKKVLVAGALAAVLLVGVVYSVVHYHLPTPNSFRIATTYGIVLEWDGGILFTSLDWGEFNEYNTSKKSTDFEIEGETGRYLHILSTDNVPEGYVAWNVTGLPEWMNLTIQYRNETGDWVNWEPNDFSVYTIHPKEYGYYFIIYLSVDWENAVGGDYDFTLNFYEADSPSG